ncbi:MAG: EVE domain-containing protein [Candidatus Sumerlaeaceae bacterium]|nr:EVE domain-containing protein [Candidatus Sumerlaeaceae bacterium]
MTSKQYWLLKSEAECFSFNDLLKAPKQTTFWDGVRNYQARNFLRDRLQPGDGVLFYHSNGDPAGVAGLAEVVRAGYPDHTAFDSKNPHFDPKSKPDSPTWYMVDIKAVKALPRFLSLAELKATKGLEKMPLLNNSRLSVQPVSEGEWKIVLKLAGL